MHDSNQLWVSQSEDPYRTFIMNTHPPLSVPNTPSFSEFINSNTSTVVVREPQLEKRDMQARAQLRSLPLFKKFGYDSVVHADLYDNDLRLVDYEFHSSEDAEGAVDQLEFPLVHVTTQDGIAEYGEEDLVHSLLERSIQEDGCYILVVDSSSPRLPEHTAKPGKSIPDVYDVTVKDYEWLSSEYFHDFTDSTLALSTTRNMYLHEIATQHKRAGVPARNLIELFDYTKIPSESPAWDPLYYFIREDLENILDDYSERVREALRSWIEKGEVMKIANSMLAALRRADFDAEQLDQYRMRNPTDR
jgi:hypothetical protein